MTNNLLAVEQSPLRLPPVQSEAGSPTGRRVTLKTGRVLDIPNRFLSFWDEAQAGASLFVIAQREKTRSEGKQFNGAFQKVALFLHFLVDKDLVDDIRLIRLSDAIRGEVEFENSFFDFFESDRIRQFSGLQVSELISQIVNLVFLMGVIGATAALALLDGSSSASYSNSIWISLAVGVIAATLARTISNLMRCLRGVLSGDSFQIFVRGNFFGSGLIAQPFRISSSLGRITDLFLIFSGPVFVLLLLRKSADVIDVDLGFVVFFLICSTALMFHPHVKSEATDSLSIWNRAPLSWRERLEVEEVTFFHRFSFLISTIAVFVSAVWVFFQYKNQTKIAGLTAVLLWVLFFFAWFEPVVSEFLVVKGYNFKRRRWLKAGKVVERATRETGAWKDLPVLRQLTSSVRDRLLEKARVVRYQRGEAICRQGDSSRSLYIVLQGSLLIARRQDGRRRKIVAEISEGSVFGETAFFFGTPRTADVVAAEPTELLEIAYSSKMKDLEAEISDEFRFRVWLLQALSSHGTFKELPSEAMDTLLFAGQRKMVKAGSVLFSEGAPANSCYFIAQGRASVLQGGKKIAQMQAGDVFGETGLLLGLKTRTGSVVADSDLLVMELSEEAFWNLLSARLSLGCEIERLALLRLKQDQQRSAAH